MSRLELDLDEHINNLEREWLPAYLAVMAARVAYQDLAINSAVTSKALDLARERMERAEAKKANIMVKIERLESTLLRQRNGRGNFV